MKNDSVLNEKEIAQLTSMISRLKAGVKDWWTKEGYHYIGDVTFTENARLKVRLGLIIDSIKSKDPVVQIDELRAKGFNVNGESADCSYFIDSDSTRESFSALIKERFPSARIDQWISKPSQFGLPDEFALTDVMIRIFDLNDI